MPARKPPKPIKLKAESAVAVQDMATGEVELLERGLQDLQDGKTKKLSDIAKEIEYLTPTDSSNLKRKSWFEEHLTQKTGPRQFWYRAACGCLYQMPIQDLQPVGKSMSCMHNATYNFYLAGESVKVDVLDSNMTIIGIEVSGRC